MHFQRPLWLLLLPLGLWFFYKMRQAKDPLLGWRAQMDAELLEALQTGNEKQGVLRPWIGFVAWGLVVIAVAGPVWRLVPSPFAEDSASLVILLKADASMTEEVSDPTPLLEAQLKVQDLIDVRPGGKVALIAYAGSAHLVLPATQDGQVIADLAMEVSPKIMPKPGDDLPAAIAKAGALLASEDGGGSLVVLADRVEAAASDVKKAWEDAGELGMQFLNLLEDADVEMKAAASAVRADVQPLTPDASDVKNIVRAAKRQIKQAQVDEGQQWAEDGWWLLFPIALCYLIQFPRKGDER
ncbi:VWA domain-containing protein [Kiritimatiellaeota bacterium B1221]|nr:VWA domain-containing protein [Kiritimatiellaeota bacterium B1221]